MEEKILNEEAFEYLDEAMFTSSKISKKDRAKGETDWDNVYPRSLAETQHMEEMLERASEVVEDPKDEDYSERYATLKEIVDWSKARHKSWSWKLILGALVGLGILYYFKSDRDDITARRKADLAKVEQWQESNVGKTSWEACSSELNVGLYDTYVNSADDYKKFKLICIKSDAVIKEKLHKEYLQKADTATTEERKNMYLSDAERYEKGVAQAHVEYDSINAMDYKAVYEMAMSDATSHVKYSEGEGKSLRNYMIFLFILIPLYIITGYPHGYTITNHRRRAGCLNIFRKFGFALAAFCFGTGIAMSLLPDYKVETRYSDGSTSTHTEANAGNFLVLFLKFGLMIVGAFIFSFVSSFIMTVETAYGLFENFNWMGWIRKVAPKNKQEEEFNKNYSK